MVSANQKIVLITGMSSLSISRRSLHLTYAHDRIGANQGVGYETAKDLVLSSSDYHVLLCSRDHENGAKAATELNAVADKKGTVEAIDLDVTNEETVGRAADQIASRFERLDVLVNNAGILEKSNDPPHERLRKVLATNTIGPVLVTDKFLPLLKKSQSPRIVFVGSSGGSLTHASDPTSPYYGSKTGLSFSHYRASKAALNMLLIEYHKALEKERFKVIGADPGLVVTNFLDAEHVRKVGAPGADVGGKTVAEVVKGERDADLGKVVGRYGVSPW